METGDRHLLLVSTMGDRPRRSWYSVSFFLPQRIPTLRSSSISHDFLSQSPIILHPSPIPTDIVPGTGQLVKSKQPACRVMRVPHASAIGIIQNPQEISATDTHRCTQMECPGAVPFEGRTIGGEIPQIALDELLQIGSINIPHPGRLCAAGLRRGPERSAHFLWDSI